MGYSPPTEKSGIFELKYEISKTMKYQRQAENYVRNRQFNCQA